MLQSLFQPTIDKKTRRIIVLVFLVLYLCIFTIDVMNSIEPILGLIFSLTILIPILFFLFLVWFISGKIKIAPFIQGLLYLTPLIILTIIPLFIKETPLLNHKTPSISYSRRYILKVTIESNKPFDTKYWKIIITDKKGEILYKDNDSDFIGFLNVYWVWDKKDNVWLYNSDDGSVYYWTLKDKKWTKNKWNKDLEKETGCELSPPKSLYPDYVFKKE